MSECDLPLTNSLDKQLLSAVINYETDIAPYPLTMIYAGLGSGKNTFAGHLMNGNAEHGIPKKTVLLITSRKAKVVETLSDKRLDISSGIGDKKALKEILKGHALGLDAYRREIRDDPRGWGNIIQRSAACNNAFIEKYHQYVYDPNDPSTHLWNRLDVIIVDEVHALVTDSTYQFSPFHTWELVKETVGRIVKARKNALRPSEKRALDIKAPACQNVILMTGTPEAVRSFEGIPVLHLLDKRAACRNVAPKNLHLIDREQALKQIKEQLKAGERILFFVNHITPVDELARLYDLPREKIAMQFSDEKRLKELERESDQQKKAALTKNCKCPETDFDKLNDIQAQLAVKELIREDIQLFVTTSKNKEGININNRDIRHVYIEEHSLTDIRQMAGRLRCGAEHAYVIVDSQGHNTYEHPSERWLTRQMCAFDLAWDDVDVLETNIHNQADAMLGYKCAQNGIWNLQGNPHSQKRAYSDDYPDVGSYINLMQKKFPYMRYNFFSNTFEYNELRERGFDFMEKEHRLFQKALAADEDFLRIFGECFPETKLHPIVNKERRAELYLQQVMDQDPDNRYTTAEINQLSLELDVILNSEKKRHKRKTEKPQPNRALHRLGYDSKRLTRKSRHCANYELWELVPWHKEAEIA